MVMFKFITIAIAIAIGELVKRQRPGLGKLVLIIGCMGSAAVVWHSLRLSGGLRTAGRGRQLERRGENSRLCCRLRRRLRASGRGHWPRNKILLAHHYDDEGTGKISAAAALGGPFWRPSGRFGRRGRQVGATVGLGVQGDRLGGHLGLDGLGDLVPPRRRLRGSRRGAVAAAEAENEAGRGVEDATSRGPGRSGGSGRPCRCRRRRSTSFRLLQVLKSLRCTGRRPGRSALHREPVRTASRIFMIGRRTRRSRSCLPGSRRCGPSGRNRQLGNAPGERLRRPSAPRDRSPWCR